MIRNGGGPGRGHCWRLNNFASIQIIHERRFWGWMINDKTFIKVNSVKMQIYLITIPWAVYTLCLYSSFFNLVPIPRSCLLSSLDVKFSFKSWFLSLSCFFAFFNLGPIPRRSCRAQYQEGAVYTWPWLFIRVSVCQHQPPLHQPYSVKPPPKQGGKRKKVWGHEYAPTFVKLVTILKVAKNSEPGENSEPW